MNLLIILDFMWMLQVLLVSRELVALLMVLARERLLYVATMFLIRLKMRWTLLPCKTVSLKSVDIVRTYVKSVRTREPRECFRCHRCINGGTGCYPGLRTSPRELCYFPVTRISLACMRLWLIVIR